jgi:hypothetical protein
MENKNQEGTDAFAAGKDKHFWMRRLSVALQKGNAMTSDAYCEWRNTRDMRVQGQAGFRAKRKQQMRPRQADAFLFRPSVPRFRSFGQCARVQKFLRFGYVVNGSMHED